MVNMTVSPDLEAYVCYAIVLILGLFTAFIQISTRLADRPGKWIMVNTWLLLSAYMLIPVALFWFLDRTSAIHDTSLFAAIVVGAGYQKILAGNLKSVQTPADVSKLWQPFAAWADSISVRISDRLADNRMRFDEKLLSSVAASPEKFDALKHVVLTHAADPKIIQAQLDAAAALQPPLTDSDVQLRQAAPLYQALKQINSRQFDYLLHRHGVISGRWYYWYAREWRSRAAALAVALVVAGGVAWGLHAVLNPQFRTAYEVWRLRKDNATDEDRYRAATRIERLLSADPNAFAEPVEDQLTTALGSPMVTPGLADRILPLLIYIDGMEASRKINSLALLSASLRTGNPETRPRIQKALLDLAQKRKFSVPQDLKTWQPDAKDSASDLDARIGEWAQVK
jgi:hypothetical protein